MCKWMMSRASPCWKPPDELTLDDLTSPDLLDGLVHGHQHGERLANAPSAAVDTHLASRKISTGDLEV